MNIAIIFAGGTGQRMHSKDRPKQFLLVHGKPIIVHTIETFQYHDEIDGIVVACLEGWIPYMEEMKCRYRLDKIGKIVRGGGNRADVHIQRRKGGGGTLWGGRSYCADS